MIVIAFATSDAYEKDAARMAESAAGFGLAVDLSRLPDQGDWERNVSLKPNFALRMLDIHHKEDVLLVDTDAYFHKSPEALLHPTFPESVALFFAGNGMPSSGTMFFKNNRLSRLFLKTWHQINVNRGLVEEFESLVAVTTKPRVVACHHLGPEYFWVERRFRPSYPTVEPVIEHFMVSKEA